MKSGNYKKPSYRQKFKRVRDYPHVSKVHLVGDNFTYPISVAKRYDGLMKATVCDVIDLSGGLVFVKVPGKLDDYK